MAVLPVGQFAGGSLYTKLSIFHTLPEGTVSLLLSISLDLPNCKFCACTLTTHTEIKKTAIKRNIFISGIMVPL
jgi:hypothetical protein